jgi:hypothetical protein
MSCNTAEEIGLALNNKCMINSSFENNGMFM